MIICIQENGVDPLSLCEFPDSDANDFFPEDPGIL